MKKLFCFLIVALSLISCKKDLKPSGIDTSAKRGIHGKPDRIAPIISFISPVNGGIVSGSIVVQLAASDNVGVTSVSLQIDNGASIIKIAAPWEFTVDTKTLSNGEHIFTSVATDAKGNTASTSISIVVDNIIAPPPPPPIFPSSFALECPPVINQGFEGSCIANVTTRAKSIEYFYRTGATSYNSAINIFSNEYCYDLTKFNDCGSGTAVTFCLDLFKTKGCALEASLPYSDLNGCDASIAAPFDEEAANYKIPSYSKFIWQDSLQIKTMVFNKHPVIVTFASDNSFLNAGPGFIWSSYSGTGGAGHGVIIVGWDDSKRAWLVMNDYGTSWGDAGFTYIDYTWLATPSAEGGRFGYYAYVMNY